MRKSSSLLILATLAASFSAGTALAEWRDRGDIHHFHEHDFDHWRGGNWFNGFHEGRTGWWWIVDGSWYFYPAPVYPYPDPYTPPGVIVEAGPPVPVGVAPSFAYYCKNPVGYYPYVPECFGHWHRAAVGTTAIVTQAPPPAQTIIVPPSPGPVGPTHDGDMQQLNFYAIKLESVDPHNPHASTELKSLEKEVDGFRQSLYKRNYNAMDILKDSEDLRRRIAERKSQWKALHTPPPVVSPAPPPGTTVVFPPQ